MAEEPRRFILLVFLLLFFFSSDRTFRGPEEQEAPQVLLPGLQGAHALWAGAWYHVVRCRFRRIVTVGSSGRSETVESSGRIEAGESPGRNETTRAERGGAKRSRRRRAALA